MPPRVRSPRLEIEYCTGCRWGLRAGWLAQELLVSFEAELGEIALVPGRVGGVFVVRLEGEVLFDRAEHARFPELRELKQAIRDRIAPGRSLGHSDRPIGESAGGSGDGSGSEP
jgi:selenoprotein W-related protein